jgi:hypothetical protein
MLRIIYPSMKPQEYVPVVAAMIEKRVPIENVLNMAADRKVPCANCIAYNEPELCGHESLEPISDENKELFREAVNKFYTGEWNFWEEFEVFYNDGNTPVEDFSNLEAAFGKRAAKIQ